MMRRLLVIGCLILAAAGCKRIDADALDPEPIPTGKDDDWREGGGWDNQFRTLISHSSISREDPSGNDQYVYAWVLRKFAAEQTPAIEDEEPYNREYARFAIDCETQKLAGIAVERHYRKNQIYLEVKNESDEDSEPTMRRDVPGYQWDFVSAYPGSFQHEFIKAVCLEIDKKDPPKKKRKSRE